MITQNNYQQIQQDTKWMLNCVRKVHSKDLSGIRVFLAPNAGITALRNGNPAVYVRRNQMNIAVRNWQNEMSNYADLHRDEYIPYEYIEKGKCIIASEAILAWPLMRRCGVLWHEYGHGYNEIAGRANTEQNAYLFEVEMIDWAATTNTFRDKGITVTQVQNYLNWRQPYFNAGITPALTDLLAKVRRKLTGMAQHGFMTA